MSNRNKMTWDAAGNEKLLKAILSQQALKIDNLAIAKVLGCTERAVQEQMKKLKNKDHNDEVDAVDNATEQSTPKAKRARVAVPKSKKATTPLNPETGKGKNAAKVTTVDEKNVKPTKGVKRKRAQEKEPEVIESEKPEVNESENDSANDSLHVEIDGEPGTPVKAEEDEGKLPVEEKELQTGSLDNDEELESSSPINPEYA